MVRKGYGRHSVVATGNNDPTRQISKDAWNDDLDNTGMFGFSKSASTVVISSGNLTPVDTWTVVESETSPTTDDLANILTTETSTEDLLFLVAKTGDTITLKHQATGSGQIHNLSQGDKILSETVPTMLVRIGTDWYEFGGGGSFTPSSTDTLTNKTIDSATNTLTLDLSEGVLTGTIAEFNTALSDGSFTTLAGTETLTNKTLTTPIISSISNTGTITLPTSTDTLVGRSTTDTLTNKTIDSSNNTVTITESNISDLGSYITASSIDTLTNKTIDGDNNTISNLAHGSEVDNPTSGVHGVTGNVVGTSDTQTLTNKNLTNPTLGASYLDIDIMSPPSDPSTGSGRIYLKTIDANNDGLFMKVKKAGSFVEVQIG